MDSSSQLIAVIKPWTDANYESALKAPDVFFGLEVWNTRTTMYSEDMSCLTINPFTSFGSWPHYYATVNAEHHFLPNLSKSLDKWDALLVSRLSEGQKIFINGGSDAHGDLNYSTSLDIPSSCVCSDNALGKVRTLVYSPGKNRGSVLDGLKGAQHRYGRTSIAHWS